MLGRTETRTRDRMYCQMIRTVRDISRDDRAKIPTCSLRTPADRLKENYSIDVHYLYSRNVYPTSDNCSYIIVSPGNYSYIINTIDPIYCIIYTSGNYFHVLSRK